MREDSDGVKVAIRNREDDREETLRTRFAIGCDGSNSVVRDSIGIEQTTEEHGKRMALLVFRSEELHELLEKYPGKSYYNVVKPGLDGYWLFFGRVELGKSWFFHGPVPIDTDKDNFDFASYLYDAVGQEFALEFDYYGFWDLRISVANNYRKGNVLIAGDAAHSHPPYGGYGINTGFEDARNLAWKLAAELHGWAGPGLLDSYSQERQPVFASTGEDFIARYIREDRDFVEQYDPQTDRDAFEAAWSQRAGAASKDVALFEPHYEGSPLVAGPVGGQSGAVGSHEVRARDGHHLAPQPRANGECVYDSFDDGFALLDLGAGEEAVKALASEASQLGVPLQVIGDLSVEAREAYDCDAVLVRPDHFIAWAGELQADKAGQVIRQAVGY